MNPLLNEDFMKLEILIYSFQILVYNKLFYVWDIFVGVWAFKLIVFFFWEKKTIYTWIILIVFLDHINKVGLDFFNLYMD